MTPEHMEFTSSGMTLAATVVSPKKEESKAGLIRIGGGSNLPHWPNNWQELLAYESITSMGFDFAGVGSSEGKLEETNLSTRLEDSRNAFETFQDVTGMNTDSIYIMGVSMGAPVAIQLANERKCEGLILVSPAAYSRNAWDKNFGEAFSRVIRTQKNWDDSQEFEVLRSFPGRILLACAEKDDVIPGPILKNYAEIVEGKGGTELTLNTTHEFLREQSSEAEAKDKFWDTVREFIRYN